MRRTLLALGFVLALLSGRAAQAQNLKIGYVDVQRALQEVDEAKAARVRLQGEVTTRRGQLDKKRADLEKMQADLEKQAPALSEDAKRKRVEELQKAVAEAQNSAGEMQQELQQKEAEAMGNISNRMLQIIRELSERDGFSFVLDKAALLYAPAASDLTNEVVRRYNDKFPNAAGKAAGNAAQKPAAGGSAKPASAPKSSTAPAPKK